ncbi:MAG: hypothetical protein FWC64_12785 [Treponema sp.]|nr:hypothetical protein [Treponema sp.]
MEQAINAYQKITATPEFREMERMRSYARHNEAAALRHARDEGREEGMEKGIGLGMEKGRNEGREETARNALAQGLAPELVHSITGLDMETIQRLSQ